MSDRDIERIQEYLDTHTNAEGLPDGVEDAKQPHDFDWTQGWDSAEVGQPENSSTDWLDVATDVITDFIPGYGDYKAFKEAETPVDYAIATATAIPFFKAGKAVKAADKVGDAVDAAKKAEKAGDTATDVAGAGNSSHIWSKGRQPSSVDNAYGHWTKHGSDFPQYRNAKEYAEGANDFVKNPPPGTLFRQPN